jgi:hypothetical protein
MRLLHSSSYFPVWAGQQWIPWLTMIALLENHSGSQRVVWICSFGFALLGKTLVSTYSGQRFVCSCPYLFCWTSCVAFESLRYTMPLERFHFPWAIHHFGQDVYKDTWLVFDKLCCYSVKPFHFVRPELINGVDNFRSVDSLRALPNSTSTVVWLALVSTPGLVFPSFESERQYAVCNLWIPSLLKVTVSAYLLRLWIPLAFEVCPHSCLIPLSLRELNSGCLYPLTHLLWAFLCGFTLADYVLLCTFPSCTNSSCSAEYWRNHYLRDFLRCIIFI